MATICTALAAAGYLSSNRASSAKSWDVMFHGNMGINCRIRLLKQVVSKAVGSPGAGWLQSFLLHQFIKKSEKTPLNELKIARNRMKEVKDAKHSERF